MKLSRVGAVLAGVCVWMGVEHLASAEEPAVPAGAVEHPAAVSIDLDTGARTVIVPPGCTASTRPNRQVVVLCPFADPDGKTPAAPVVSTPTRPWKKPKKEWYGWQILIADGASIASGAGIALASSGDGKGVGLGIGVGIAGYALAPAIVHWANGQVGPGFGSMSLRVGAPLVMAAWGIATGVLVSSDSDTQAAFAGVGAAAGVIGAIIVDVAVLAHRPVDEAERDRVSGARKKPAIQWMPTANYDSKRQSAVVGLAGSF